MKKLLVITSLLLGITLPSVSFSADLNLFHGVGTAFARKNGDGTPGKINSLGAKIFFRDYLYVSADLGAWNSDNVFNSGYTGFLGLGIGIKVESDLLYFSASVSPSLVTRTKGRLSGNLQFLDKISVGLSSDSVYGGISYHHFSNGGMSSPNTGRDYVGVEFSLRGLK